MKPRGPKPKYEVPTLGQYAVYRLFDHMGGLLYIGVTRSFKSRMHTHAASQTWRREIDESQITVEWFDNMQDAAERERSAIWAELPKHNKSGKPGQRKAPKFNPAPALVSLDFSKMTDNEVEDWANQNMAK